METSTRTPTRTACCPACGADVRLVGRVLIGEVFGCSSCAAQIEVASADPVQLEPFDRIENEEADLA